MSPVITNKSKLILFPIKRKSSKSMSETRKPTIFMKTNNHLSNQLKRMFLIEMRDKMIMGEFKSKIAETSNLIPYNKLVSISVSLKFL